MGWGDGDEFEGVDGEGVEEFVGEDEGGFGGCVGNGLDGVGPDDGDGHVFADAVPADFGLGHRRIGTAEEGLLDFSELGAGLDHVDGVDAVSHGREFLYGSKHIVHESATTRANFDELYTLVGAPLSHPLGDKPDADKLAEDL